MRSLTIDDLMLLVSSYSAEEKKQILEAYKLACKLHHGQMRESGEPYIIHPLNVAYILAEMHADADTISAGLLHDTIEDSDITKEDLREMFNKDVAALVDGVTKLAKMNFSSKEDKNAANTRKIITSITEDVRIIIIKLADRLHNMKTLEHKKEFKQKENALETMEVFVPLAYYIGAYRLKSELEDLSLKYLKPEAYQNISEKIEIITKENDEWVKEMLYKIKSLLEEKNIPNEIKFRVKNIYGVYKKLEHGLRLNDIHDLFAIKIMVNEIDECYLTLCNVHKLYNPINRKFKDYICNPKTNMYQSLHTTVFGPNDTLVQTQIRTFDMDKIDNFGLTAYWDIHNEEARNVMQQTLREKYQFFKSLVEINKVFGDNKEFISQIKKELFGGQIYVYTTDGDIKEFPVGATLIDFAYEIHTDIGNTLIGGYVNDEYVSVEHVLHNQDRVKAVTNDLAFGPKPEWENIAVTTKAKRRIREFNRK